MDRRKRHEFEHYSPAARDTIVVAQHEAARLGHNYVGTEHLLLALLHEGPSSVSRRLSSLGLSLAQARNEVVRIVGTGETEESGERSLTRRAKDVLRVAEGEAKRARHELVTPEHLLTAILRNGNGIAAGVLASAGITIAHVQPSLRAGEREPRSARGNVVMCRLDDRSMEAIDALIEAGICTTRSDGAAWLIAAGVESKRALYASVEETIREIRRLRDVARAAAVEHAAGDVSTNT